MGVRLLERLQIIIKSELFDPVEAVSERQNTPRIDQLRDDLKHELGSLLAEQYSVSKSASQLSPKIADLNHKAAQAVELGRDDLAKAALTEKTYLAAEREQIQTRLDRLGQNISGIEAVLKTLTGPSTPTASLKAQLEELNALLSQNTTITDETR